MFVNLLEELVGPIHFYLSVEAIHGVSFSTTYCGSMMVENCLTSATASGRVNLSLQSMARFSVFQQRNRSLGAVMCRTVMNWNPATYHHQLFLPCLAKLFHITSEEVQGEWLRRQENFCEQFDNSVELFNRYYEREYEFFHRLQNMYLPRWVRVGAIRNLRNAFPNVTVPKGPDLFYDILEFFAYGLYSYAHESL